MPDQKNEPYFQKFRIKEVRLVAKPIKATPVLKGQDLRRLIQDVRRPDRGHEKRKLAREYLRRATTGGY